ncbi:replication-associated protein [Pacific flying fox faeces associated circular DNA virus-12]|nr:replication-associated protein [Pacific flying fox faeces associated circular DNA virus-12]
MQYMDDAAADVERPDIIAAQFRLSAKNLFLTYPHCGVQLEIARDIILEALGRGNVEYMVVAHERHQDGDLHIHAVVCLIVRCDIRNANLLDLGEYHGNYQAIRNVRASVRYVKKDNVFIEYGTINAKYADAEDRAAVLAKLVQCTSEADAMHFIYVNGHARESYLLLQYWKTKQGESKPGARFARDAFLPCASLLAALEELEESDRCLLLIGPSGWGKTQYLLAHYNERQIVRATHMDDLKKISKTTEILILDDLSYGHLPRQTLLHLFDMKTDRSVHVRYTVANLHQSLLVILVGNELELVLGAHIEDVAVMRRVTVFQLPHRLWD